MKARLSDYQPEQPTICIALIIESFYIEGKLLLCDGCAMYTVSADVSRIGDFVSCSYMSFSVMGFGRTGEAE